MKWRVIDGDVRTTSECVLEGYRHAAAAREQVNDELVVYV
jgi:hypothetical protein